MGQAVWQVIIMGEDIFKSRNGLKKKNYTRYSQAFLLPLDGGLMHKTNLNSGLYSQKSPKANIKNSGR